MTTHPEPLQPLDPRLIALDMALRVAKISATHRPPASEILGSADAFLGWLTMPMSPSASDDPADHDGALIVTDPATLANALHLTNGAELPWTFDVADLGTADRYRWSLDHHGVERLWGERDTDPTDTLTAVVAALNAPATEGRVTTRRGPVEVSWPAGWQTQAMEHAEMADRIAVLTAQRDELLAQSDATRGWRDILQDPADPVDPGEVVRWLIHHHPIEAAVMMHRLDHLHRHPRT